MDAHANIEHPAAEPAASGKKSDKAGILKLGLIGAVAASLCCLTPVVLVMIGLGVAAIFGPEILGFSSTGEFTQKVHQLTDRWYDDYKWWFRIGGLAIVIGGIVFYFRRRGVCTLDQAKRHRNRIINVTLVTIILAGVVYWVWTYVILHYWGVGIGLPW
ncbi:MAG: hypothetical protein ACYTF1_17730 [Planctomycetota bacterium]|jgi:hypothetical protein